MTSDLEFRLIGGPAPDGEIRLRDLGALTEALQEVSLRIGRDSINATGPGRTKQFMEEFTELRLSAITTGSTRLLLSRGPTDKLDVSLAEQRLVDDRFWELIAAVGGDARPDWVSELIAESAAKLVVALKNTAPQVEASSPGRPLVRIATAKIHSETWVAPRSHVTTERSAAGLLEKVDLRTHDFRIRDDVGQGVDLRNVVNDVIAAQLVGQWVVARGVGVLHPSGQLIALDEVTIEQADDPAAPYLGNEVDSLDMILSSAPGPDINGGIDLTYDEFAEFLKAVRS